MTKLMKILIAYDGSPCADQAIEDLQRAGLPQQVEAIVLSVADLWLLPGIGDEAPPMQPYPSKMMAEARATAATMLEAAQGHAERAAGRLRATFPTWHVEAKSVADSPAWAIVLEAERQRADLIVVGAHGYSPLARWILGSVSQTVLTQAPCSVRIAREGRADPNRPLRILVGVDGSSEAEMAVRAITERVWPAGTDIRLMMVLDPSILASIQSSATAGGDVAAAIETAVDIDSEIKQILDGYLAIVGQNASGISASTILVPGDAKRVLVEEADRWGADCIFIGSRGLTRWERLLLGSVSTAVAARAHCPVEVIRAPRHSL